MTAQPRVLCVALDAADQGLLQRWAAEGHLPTVRKLLERSARVMTYGPLGMIASVWQTFYTATLPGKQGRYADHQIRTGTYELYRFLPTHLKREPFWLALSQNGFRVAIVDVPYVALSRGLNGIHVVDWTTHAADEGFGTWPPELAREIVTRCGRDAVGLCDDLDLRSADDISRFRDALVARIGQKVALTKHLMNEAAWDFFLVSFSECHCVGHQCWHLNDPHHPEYDAEVARIVGNPMRDVYAAIDRALQTILQGVGDDTTVCLLATHGMGPYYNGAHLLGEILRRLGHLPAVAEPTAARRLMRRVWRWLPARIRAPLIPLQKALVDRTRPALDHRGACFDVPSGEVFGAVRVNLVGREPRGRVNAGAEFDSFCATLSNDLLALTNVETGAPAVRRVLRTRDLFNGPQLDDLPDLLVEWNNSAPLRCLHSAKTGTIRGVQRIPRTGHHVPEGLFAVHAPGIEPGTLNPAVSIADVAATLAGLLGVSLQNVDGRPISLPTVACGAKPATPHAVG